jgi:hypothetical protein
VRVHLTLNDALRTAEIELYFSSSKDKAHVNPRFWPVPRTGFMKLCFEKRNIDF